MPPAPSKARIPRGRGTGAEARRQGNLISTVQDHIDLGTFDERSLLGAAFSSYAATQARLSHLYALMWTTTWRWKQPRAREQVEQRGTPTGE